MEHRSDLEDLLLAGLPAGEREHVVKTMRAELMEDLRHKRAQRDPRVVDSQDALADS